MYYIINMSSDYEYALTSKQELFLWLYQLIPNLDIIKYIYEKKCSLENEETLFYYGFMPQITFLPTSNYSYTMNVTQDNWSKKVLNATPLYMKLVTTPGLICKFISPNTLTDVEEELMNNGFWEFYAIAIDEEPSMKEKITCINKIIEEGPYFSDDVCEKLKHLVRVYESTVYSYVHRDHEIDFARIGIDEKGDWHIPSIYF
jgi:hypothetical protein